VRAKIPGTFASPCKRKGRDAAHKMVEASSAPPPPLRPPAPELSKLSSNLPNYLIARRPLHYFLGASLAADSVGVKEPGWGAAPTAGLTQGWEGCFSVP
jgi:hypothetical protein